MNRTWLNDRTLACAQMWPATSLGKNEFRISDGMEVIELGEKEAKVLAEFILSALIEKVALNAYGVREEEGIHGG